MDPASRLKELNNKANDFTFDNKIPVKRYIRSSKEMERMALVYAAENEWENGFLLYMKMITLLVEKIPKHSSYKTLSPDDRAVIRKRCQSAFSAAEKLKKALKSQFQKEYDDWLKNEEERKKQEEEQRIALEKSKKSSNTPETSFPVAPLKTPIPNEVPPITTFGAYPNIPEVAPNNERVQPSAPPSYEPSSPQYHEPSPSYEPQLPPSYDQAMDYNTVSVAELKRDVPSIDRSSKPTITPEVNRDKKPQDAIFRQDSSLDGNRKIIISSDLVPKFLQLSSRNTRQNLETCAILTGKLSQNRFFITHLVVPKQSATPDSCTTECEEELFDVQDKYDLITLGWIHTHPSQTSFLSSVDLHTQCSYQQLMPEAIAIVCSPKYNTTGIYRLTPNHGLNFIASCSQSGFHPHPKEPPLFEDSPLVHVENGSTTEVVDLR